MPCKGINSVVLYEGSITSFDSRLHGFDIGTCLEVLTRLEALTVVDCVSWIFPYKVLIVFNVFWTRNAN